MRHNFIGFADSDKFLNAASKERPINPDVSRKHGHPDKKYGMAIDMTVLTLSQVQGSEALYFQHAVHKYQTIRGEIFQDRKNVTQLVDQILAAAKQYLTEMGYQFREALLSMPANYIILDGEPTFLKYTKEEGYIYFYAPKLVGG